MVLADVLNAGALYVPAPEGTNWWEHVVADRDLVTSMSAVHNEAPVGTERLVDAIRDAILAVDESPARPTPGRAWTTPAEGDAHRILVLLSEWGFWGEELVGPLEAFDEHGYELDFATPNGRRPVAIG